MAFNGSGTYSRTNGTYTGSTVWNQDATNGVKIESARHDTHDQDIATALSNCICKDGQTTVTANLPMATYKHTNVAVATARTDYARYSQVQDSSAVFATGAGSSGAYTLTLAPAITAYAAGQRFFFIANHANSSAAPTLNVNGVGAVDICKPNGTASPQQLEEFAIQQYDLVEVTYDGAVFLLTGKFEHLRPSTDATFEIGNASFGYSRVYAREYTSSASSDILFTTTGGTEIWRINLSDGSLTQNGTNGGDVTITRSAKAFRSSVETSISAAGTVAGTATQLTKMMNVVTAASAGASDGVALPLSVGVGAVCEVLNAVALGASVKIYPGSGDSIDNMSSSTAATREIHRFLKTAATTWYRIGAGAA